MNPEVTMYTFDTPQPVDLRAEIWQGEIYIHAEERDTTTAELESLHGDAQELIEHTRVEQRGSEVSVLTPKGKSGFFRTRGEIRATIRVPLRSNVQLESASADSDLHGELGDVRIASGSGDVRIEFGEDIQVRTGSGDVDIVTAAGRCDTKCGSGDLKVETIGGDADMVSGSGDVILGHAAQSLKVKTGSGDIVVREAGEMIDAMAGSGDLRVKRFEHGKLRAKTGSGDIQIGVADGTAAYLDITTVTGDVRSSLDASDAPSDGDQTVELSIQSGTGDVVLQRA